MSTTPRLVPSTVAGLSGVLSIAAGTTHTCAVRADGTVACWGNNFAGQLGTGDTTSRPTPTPVVGLSGSFVAVTAGVNHTCARRADGAVFCWGQNTNGQLGNGSTTGMGPAMVTGVTAVEVAAGYFNTCARLADGTVRCWGQNNYGQVGDGTTAARATPTPVRLAAPAAEVRVGAAFACARLTTQAIQCWGYNLNGALGDGTTANRPTPANVVGVTDAVALAVANSSHGCARVAAGGIRCWGYNRLGQVGDGSSANRTTPVAIAGL
jgi:alpha-tubulin suppressor-like RCC1 family protein